MKHQFWDGFTSEEERRGRRHGGGILAAHITFYFCLKNEASEANGQNVHISPVVKKGMETFVLFLCFWVC